MSKIKFLLISALSFAFTNGYAQSSSDDFGLDVSLKGQHKMLNKRLTLDVEGGYRTQDHTSRTERFTIGAGVSYKIIDKNKWELKGAFDYVHIWMNKLAEINDKSGDHYKYYDMDENGSYVEVDDDVAEASGYEYSTVAGADHYMEYDGWNVGYNKTFRYWQNRDRMTLSAELSYSPSKRWTFSWMEGLQYTHYWKTSTRQLKYREKHRYNGDGDEYTTISADTVSKNIKTKNRYVLRSRLGVEYNIKGLPINPFINAEYGCGLNYTANKWKFTAGAEYEINKKNNLEVFYRFKTEDDDDEPDGHIIGLAYTHKF
jgi:hypothetical protein